MGTMSEKDWVVWLSRLIWDQVVSPGWLDHDNASHKYSTISSNNNNTRHKREKARVKTRVLSHVATLFSLAEATSPLLVGLICNRVLRFGVVGVVDDVAAESLASSHNCNCRYYVGTYRAILNAASVPSASCVQWILDHRRQMKPKNSTQNSGQADGHHLDECTEEEEEEERAVIKEVAAVLVGLCCCGSVEMARMMFGDSEACGRSSFFAGTLPSLWDGRRVIGWARVSEQCCGNSAASSCENVGGRGLREKVREYVRAECGHYPAFTVAVRSGHVDTVKWLASVLGISRENAPWMFSEVPLSVALRGGKMDMVEFLFDEGLSAVSSTLIAELGCTVEDCLWMETHILKAGARACNLNATKNVDVAKWVLSILPRKEPYVLNLLLHSVGEVSLAEWLVTEERFEPTEYTFELACCTPMKKGSSLARWLSKRVTLSQSDILTSFTKALSHGNVEVAEWMEETFHVMDVVNSNPESAGSMLLEVCREYHASEENDAGLKWFIRHLSHPQGISADTIEESISAGLAFACSSFVPLLLEAFPQFHLHSYLPVFQRLVASMGGDINTIKRLLQTPPLPTREFVTQCLTSANFLPESSKVVKWMIRQFHLDSSHIRANNNGLLFTLLSIRKNKCAEWLIDSFDIPFSEILEMVKACPGNNYNPEFDLAGWKMILRKYQRHINTEVILQHLMPVVTLSPHIALFTMHRFGITLSEVEAEVNRHKHSPLLVQTWITAAGWLDDGETITDTNANANISYNKKNKMRRSQTRHAGMFSLAEALFPLVGRVCRRILGFSDYWNYVGTYRAISSAANLIRHPTSPLGQRTGSGLHLNVTPQEEGVVVKEVAAVLLGLCCGGHVAEAQKLFGGSESRGGGSFTGTLPRLWDGRRVSRWEDASRCGGGNSVGSTASQNNVVGGRELRHKVSEYVCGSGGDYGLVAIASLSGVDSLRWLVSALGVAREDARWMMQELLLVALQGGKLDVAECLVDEVGLPASPLACGWCASGKAPGRTRWCSDKLAVEMKAEIVQYPLLTNKRSTVEDCRWLERRIHEKGVDGYILNEMKNANVAKWVLSILPGQAFSSIHVGELLQSVGDVSLAEWFVTEKGFVPNVGTFMLACCTPMKRGSSLAKWMSTRFILTEADIITSFAKALGWGNVEVANWLQDTFHVMDVANHNPCIASSVLLEICQEEGIFVYDDAGLKWFIQHLSQPNLIPEDTIQDAVSAALAIYCTCFVPLLLKAFPQFRPQRDPPLLQSLIEFMGGDINTIKRLLQTQPLPTTEFVAQCLTSDQFLAESSKVVKWMIQQFHLESSHVRANSNRLLFTLLSRKKNRCAEWLIDSFGIPFSDIVEMAPLWTGDCCQTPPDLDGWNMILRKYQRHINTSVIRQHLMPIVTLSPHISHSTMLRFGITLSEIDRHNPEERFLL
ncbi:hypothetical protein Pelo_3592 [Pelomyxa schiedti]|nr:hypothetical protein Pelo_3592 [Pelomyxa schiedti]